MQLIIHIEDKQGLVYQPFMENPSQAWAGLGSPPFSLPQLQDPFLSL